jgi:peptidoglycan hydrolase FlgJ
MSMSTSLMGIAGVNTEAAALQRHAKLQDAAEKFEGLMLEELLKPMQEGQGGAFGGFGGGFGGDDTERDGSLDTMSSYGTEAVANAIAKSGGLGIAKQVMRQLGGLDGHSGDSKTIEGKTTRIGSLDGAIKKKS